MCIQLTVWVGVPSSWNQDHINYEIYSSIYFTLRNALPSTQLNELNLFYRTETSIYNCNTLPFSTYRSLKLSLMQRSKRLFAFLENGTKVEATKDCILNARNFFTVSDRSGCVGEGCITLSWAYDDSIQNLVTIITVSFFWVKAWNAKKNKYSLLLFGVRFHNAIYIKQAVPITFGHFS